MTKTLTIRRPDDFHVHFRDDERTAGYIRAHASQFARALVMPNLRPKPVENNTQADEYYMRLNSGHNADMRMLMTIQITPSTSAKTIKACKHRVIAAKLYPEGVTTNSENGVKDLKQLGHVFEAMRDAGMVLCLHGEKPGYRAVDAESSFVGDDLDWLARNFPGLKIVLEHATTRDAIDAVQKYEYVACTITAHHLELTLDDVIGNGLRPHNYCKPVAKSNVDRDALRFAATSGHPRIFFGSDSAPHLRKNKECDCGAAGVYTGPLAMPLLATRFEELGKLEFLEDFVSSYGATWYRLPYNDGELTLERVPWTVPKITKQGVVPFMAGRQIAWRVKP